MVNNILDSGAGQGLTVQVNKALAEIRTQLNLVRKSNPDSKFIFVTTGFSRGAAAARVLHNRLLQEGVPSDFDAGAFIINPGEVFIGASVLFDTVTTQMLDIDQSLYEIPESIIQVLHITAQNEYRTTFPLKSAFKVENGYNKVLSNVREISVSGAHSDIGGSYTYDGISAVTLEMAMSYLKKVGIPLSLLDAEFKPNASKFVIHDSRFHPLMPFEKQMLGPRKTN